MNLVRFPGLDVVRLAADYSAAIRDNLTDGQLLNVRNGDAVAADYTDTGELIAEAIYLQAPGAESIADYADEINDADQRATASGYRLSRILVACEWSGTLRDAFNARGHHATSCDILPSATPGRHYQGDARDVIGDGYDMLVSFPPCTYLSSCQLWRCKPEHDKQYPARQNKSDAALEFVRDLMAAPVSRQALENPRGRIGSAIRKADQEIHPYQFGHDVSKTTGLWLDGLDKLTPDPADYIEPQIIEYKGKPARRWSNQSPCGADKMGPSKDRGHKRGKTYEGIAEAMADTWGGIAAKARQAATPAAYTAGQQLALF